MAPSLLSTFFFQISQIDPQLTHPAQPDNVVSHHLLRVEPPLYVLGLSRPPQRTEHLGFSFPCEFQSLWRSSSSSWHYVSARSSFFFSVPLFELCEGRFFFKLLRRFSLPSSEMRVLVRRRCPRSPVGDRSRRGSLLMVVYTRRYLSDRNPTAGPVSFLSRLDDSNSC